MGQDKARPHFPANLVGDFGGGSTYLVIGVLAALLEAKLSGQGQVVDAAIVDGTAHLNAMSAGFLAGGNLLRGAGREPARRRDAVLRRLRDLRRPAHVGGPARAAVLRRVREAARASRTRPTATTSSAPRSCAASSPSGSRRRTQAEWSEVFEGTDACVAPIIPLTEAMEHPHMAAREVFVEHEGVRQPAPAPRFSRTTAEPRPPSATQGRRRHPRGPGRLGDRGRGRPDREGRRRPGVNATACATGPTCAPTARPAPACAASCPRSPSSVDFAIDKPSGVPCPHLATATSAAPSTPSCRERGFPGCTVYDCFGAGQRVVAGALRRARPGAPTPRSATTCSRPSRWSSGCTSCSGTSPTPRLDGCPRDLREEVEGLRAAVEAAAAESHERDVVRSPAAAPTPLLGEVSGAVRRGGRDLRGARPRRARPARRRPHRREPARGGAHRCGPPRCRPRRGRPPRCRPARRRPARRRPRSTRCSSPGSSCARAATDGATLAPAWAAG